MNFQRQRSSLIFLSGKGPLAYTISNLRSCCSKILVDTGEKITKEDGELFSPSEEGDFVTSSLLRRFGNRHELRVLSRAQIQKVQMEGGTIISALDKQKFKEEEKFILPKKKKKYPAHDLCSILTYMISNTNQPNLNGLEWINIDGNLITSTFYIYIGGVYLPLLPRPYEFTIPIQKLEPSIAGAILSSIISTRLVYGPIEAKELRYIPQPIDYRVLLVEVHNKLGEAINELG